MPGEHLVDAGFVDAGNLVHAQTQTIDLIGPAPADTSWQARDNQGFDIAHFVIDWDAQHVTCPAGRPSHTWTPHTHPKRGNSIEVRFAVANCRACPARTQCTRAAPRYPRTLKLLPYPLFEALHTARQRQHTAPFKAIYTIRAGIKGTFSQGVRVIGLRFARYDSQLRGIAPFGERTQAKGTEKTTLKFS